MSRLCERPGCSEPGAAAYGMVPEDLLFWIAPLDGALTTNPAVLCRRHADAMVVPRGWTLDDRREAQPRLFKPRASRGAADDRAPRPKRRRHAGGAADGEPPQQLQIDGTGEIERPPIEAVASLDDPLLDAALPDDASADGWQPDFDDRDDLGGLLEVTSPLLARAFRGTDRPRR